MSSLNSNKWRFTFETQAHSPNLRLYLFNPNINPSNQCLDLKSELLLAESLLLVTWTDPDNSEEVLIRVPVPRVLIDPDSAVETVARDDHIEAKLRLVLPVDHPVVANVREVLGSGGDLDRFWPIELDSDLKNLSSGDVHLFCKACSTRLTKQPLSHFMEMPSVNWREVADNWFGACCCSFGGISEKLVLQYIKTYSLVKGTCLLDSASAIVCKDDLEGCTFQQYLNGQSNTILEVLVEPNGNEADTVEENCHSPSKYIPSVSVTFTCLDHKPHQDISDPESKSHKCGKHNSLSACSTSPVDCSNLVMGHDTLSTGVSYLSQLSLGETPNIIDVDCLRLHLDSCSVENRIPQAAEKLSTKGHTHSCTEHVNAQQFSETYGPERIKKWLHDCSLGSGFLTRTANLSNDVEWVEFMCRNCSSILGAYPSYKTKYVPLDGGVRLYKCYLSTSSPANGPNDMFRKHTLERVFASLLLECAKDELSYRIVLSDLRTKSPVLQLVLLNSDSWCCSGYCSENATMGSLPEADLQPVVKVLFSDCTTDTEIFSRVTKDWASKMHTEEVYMMSHQIEELLKCLRSAASRLPASCSYLQGMSMSSIDR